MGTPPFAFQHTKNLNRFLREYGVVCLNDVTPAAPVGDGNTNIHWQTDLMGNMSAYVSVPDFLIFKGAWSSVVTYSIGNVVTFSGSTYASLIDNNLNLEPDTHPSDWVQIGGGGGGGGNILPGDQYQLSIYPNNGEELGPSNITTDSTGNNLTVPGGIATAAENITNNYVSPTGLFGPLGSVSAPINAVANIDGPGWSLGNPASDIAGGWSNSFGDTLQFNPARRGITQMYSGDTNKHAVGDCAVMYHHLFTTGGATAASDEGTVGCNIFVEEYGAYFHGQVVSSTGLGDTQPVLNATSGVGFTQDGGFLLNMSAAAANPITARCSAPSTTTGTTFTTIAGTAPVSWLQNFPIIDGPLPISTAIGIVTSGTIGYQNNTMDDPQPVTLTVDLAEIGGIKQPFTAGSMVTVAGMNYPEQAKILTASTPSGGTQTLTMHLRNPNEQAVLFQGGVQGTYLSWDANLAFSGMRSSYYAFGSLTGNELIYGFQVNGTLVSAYTPAPFAEAAQSDGGPNSIFHLIPGAEIVANRSQNADVTLEQNGITWVGGTLAVAKVVTAPSGGHGAVYSWTSANYGPDNSLAGKAVSIAFWSNPQNNGNFLITANTATTITTNNMAGVNETKTSPGDFGELTYSDEVENPHNPAVLCYAGAFNVVQTSPSLQGYTPAALTVGFEGAGAGGPGTRVLLVQSSEAYGNYLASGGPIQAPDGIQLTGCMRNPIYIQSSPDHGGAVIFVQSPLGTATTGDTTVITLDYSSVGGAGNMTFNNTSSAWHVDRFDSNIYSVGGTLGAGSIATPVTFTSADGKTVTVVAGLITSVV